MIKSELIQRIGAANPHLYQRDVERIVNTILEEIIAALARGDRVELRGFGAFTVKHRAARQGRNPRTGETVFVEEKYVPFFKTGKELRERLNRDYDGANVPGVLRREADRLLTRRALAGSRLCSGNLYGCLWCCRRASYSSHSHSPIDMTSASIWTRLSADDPYFAFDAPLFLFHIRLRFLPV